MTDRSLTKQQCACGEPDKRGTHGPTICEHYPGVGGHMLTSNEKAPTHEYSPESGWQVFCPRCHCEIKTLKTAPHSEHECILALLAKVQSWEKSCTGRHGSQQPCVSGDSSAPETKAPQVTPVEVDRLIEWHQMAAGVTDQTDDFVGARMHRERLRMWEAHRLGSSVETGAPQNEKCQHDLQVPGNSIVLTDNNTRAVCVYCAQEWLNPALPQKASVPRCPWCGGQHIGTDCKAEKANAEVRTDAGVSPASHAEEVPLAEGSVLKAGDES